MKQESFTSCCNFDSWVIGKLHFHVWTLLEPRGFVPESHDLSTIIEAEVDSEDGLWFFGLKPFSTFVLFVVLAP